MRIALCDGNMTTIGKTKQMIYEYANFRHIELLVEEYGSGAGLLASGIKYPLIILDYEIRDINGLETARLLRKSGASCTIIFLSAYTGFILESFQVKPYRFLLKPLDRRILFAALDDFFKERTDDRPIWIKDGDNTFCLNTNDIYYLEAANKNCFVILRNKKIRCHKTMARLYGVLPENHFGKINRAYVVNFNYIAGYSSDSVTLHSGERLHISRSYSKSFKEKYRDFSKPREL